MKTEQTASPQEILKLATVHYKVIIVIVLVCTAVAYMETRELYPSYSSKATLYVDPQDLSPVDSSSSADLRDTDVLSTQVDLITMSGPLEHAIEISPELQKYYEVDLDDKKSVSKAVSNIKGKISAKLRGDTLLIDITTKAGDRDLTYWISKYTSIGFTNYVRTLSRSRSTGGVGQLEGTKTLVQEDLKKAQDALAAFRREYEVNRLDEEKLKLENKNDQDKLELGVIEKERKTITYDRDRINSYSFIDTNSGEIERSTEELTIIDNKLEELYLIPSVSTDEEFRKNNAKFKASKSDLKTLQIDLKPLHPKMRIARRNVETLRDLVIETIAAIPTRLNAKINRLDEQIKELEIAIENQKLKLDGWNEIFSKYTELKADEDIANAGLEMIQERVSELELSTEAEGTNIYIAEEASEPSTIQPNKKQKS
jgi:uncharacterized protein involved in exopolysaccharide biosynthesis